MLGKFWDHFWYLSLLHFAHNTKNGSSNDRTRLFCNVMHLHTENCFHFTFFVCILCFNSNSAISGASCVKKMETEFLALSLFPHSVTVFENHSILSQFRFFFRAKNSKYVLTHFLSYFSGKNQVTELIWLQKLSGKWDIFWWFLNNVPQSKGKRGQGE